MNVLSLFDGMSCGQIALKQLGIQVDRYVSYEIDKYAIRTTMHNFPNTEQCGDVFDADFKQYEGFDLLCGGSPCTYWSIAQTRNRETVASGLGWELFSQYVRALHEAKPRYFIYENNKSMSKEIRASIDDAFGFEAVLINSALVSAQNRQRLYWVGKRNADGTYSKVNIEQPEDRGILLKDVLDNAVAIREKAHAAIASAARTTEREFFTRNQGNMVAEPICVASRGRNPDNLSDRTTGMPTRQHLEAHTDGKTNTLTSVSKDNLIAEPVGLYECPKDCEIRITDNSIRCMRHNAKHSTVQGTHVNFENGKAQTLSPSHVTQCIQWVGSMPRPNGELSTSAGFRIYSTEAKGRYLCANGGGAGAKMGLYALPVDEPIYATPCEWDENGEPTKAVSCAGGKIYTVYKVENGQITIKGKQYPIKLADGYYIIRKLTVSECKRLQTVPDWYDFSCVSNSQAYKMLGNGWTVEVIMHLIRRATDAT